MQKNETGPLSYCPQVNSKWIEDLNVISETIKSLEQNGGSKLPGIDLGNDF